MRPRRQEGLLFFSDGPLDAVPRLFFSFWDGAHTSKVRILTEAILILEQEIGLTLPKQIVQVLTVHHERISVDRLKVEAMELDTVDELPSNDGESEEEFPSQPHASLSLAPARAPDAKNASNDMDSSEKPVSTTRVSL